MRPHAHSLSYLRPLLAATAGLALLSSLLAGPALAQIVALGASQTAGRGVTSSEAYPAQLEAMLRAEGIPMSVTNAGISGDTTDRMLRRLDSAVPQGTRLVILQPGGNDARTGGGEDRSENIDAIRARLQARGIRMIVLGGGMLQSIPAGMRQHDQIHFTAEGYRLLASRMLPRVKAALGG